jgi:hypothetical protein
MEFRIQLLNWITPHKLNCIWWFISFRLLNINFQPRSTAGYDGFCICTKGTPRKWIDSKEFWRWCIAHRITVFFFFYFFHRPVLFGVEIRRFGNWNCLRPQVKGGGRRYLVGWGPQKELISITAQLLSDLHSYLLTRNQANSAGDNNDVNNRNCDKACTCVELG